MVDVIEAETNPGYNFYKPQKPTAKKKFSAKDLSVVSIFAIFIIIAILALTPSLLIDSVLKPLISHADVQEATYTIESEWAFVQNLDEGKLSPDIITTLKENKVLVGSIINGNFVESNTGTLLKTEDGTIYNGDSFYKAINSDSPNITLYTAFKKSIPSYAALYNDEHAVKKFAEAGTKRNNYSQNSTLETVGEKVVEKGSDITIDSTIRVLNEKKEYEYYSIFPSNTKNLNNLANSLLNSGSNDAARAKANAIITAANDRTSKQTAVIFMECLEKTEAGDGQDEVHDCMNWFTTSKTTSYIDENGNKQEITGSPSESPSITAALTGSKISDSAKYYANDYALKLTDNPSIAANTPASDNILSAIKNTITSFSSTIRGAITNFLTFGAQKVEASILTPILPLLDTSVVNNSFKNIEGIYGGQMLWKGLVNIQGDLAAGAIPSSEENVLAFNQINTRIAKLDATFDQQTKSPLDITSENTFLGSIYYNILPTILKTTSITSTLNKSILNIIPGAHADNQLSYYTDFGACESATAISAACTKDGIISRVYDANLLNANTLKSPEFKNFVESNTYLDSKGNRKVKDNSPLADFITLYGENNSPLGTFNINLVVAKRNNTNFLSTLLNLTDSVAIFLNATNEEKAIATGSAFVNSSSNPYYEKYKYASIYVSFARTLAILRASDPVAYNNFPLFEGPDNPVIAYLDEYNTTHPQDTSFTGYLSSITGLTTTEIDNYLQVANYNPTNSYSFTNSQQTQKISPLNPHKAPKSFINTPYIIYSDLRNKNYLI